MTKQFGTLRYQADLALTEQIASTVNVEMITALTQTYGVAKHDDEFLPGDGLLSMPAPLYNGGISWGSVEEIDLRSMYNDGMILDDIRINLQRTMQLPIVEEMYNVDPGAVIYESIIITTDPYPLNKVPEGGSIQGEYDLQQFHQAGFRPMRYKTNGNLTKGMGTPESLIFQQTRKYKHDPSRGLTGDAYTSYSEPGGPPTIFYTDLLMSDDVIRGYPDFISASTLYVYRIFSSYYNFRSPALLAENTVNLQTSRTKLVFPPLQITVSGNTRKGTESERIMKATDSLLQQPARPADSRP